MLLYFSLFLLLLLQLRDTNTIKNKKVVSCHLGIISSFLTYVFFVIFMLAWTQFNISLNIKY
jgi:hypothetical protein